MQIRITIYEDNPSLRETLTRLINSDPELRVCGAFPNALHCVEETDELRPDLILMDIAMPGITGIEGLKKIRRQTEEVIILIFTVFEDDRNVFEAIKAGANGYLLKNTPPERILQAIREAHSGGVPMSPFIARQVMAYFRNQGRSAAAQYRLTSRETEILDLLVNGYSYKMIAADRSISLDTVRTHVRSIYEKLHVNSKAQAVAKALKEKLT